MKLQLEDSVASLQDIKSVIIDVRQYAKWYSQAYIKGKVTNTAPDDQPAILPAAANLINQAAENGQVSQKILDDLIIELEDFAATAPHMTITLAAPAPKALKTSIIQWCRQNIAPNILVDFRFNSTMLGGMVVAFGSHVYDWSFKQQILAARSKFPEVLRRV